MRAINYLLLFMFVFLGFVTIVFIKKPTSIKQFFSRNRLAYLTIDDGPSSNTKAKIDYLVKNNIPAILFYAGQHLEKTPEIAIYAIQKGFIIGNHSYAHQRASDTDFYEVQEGILKTEKIIDALYQKAGVKRQYKVFRFPYGDKDFHTVLQSVTPVNVVKTNYQTFLKNHGFKKLAFENIGYIFCVNQYIHQKDNSDIDVSWAFDSRDYVLCSPVLQERFGLYNLNDLLNRMDENDSENGLGLNNGSSNEIILMHDFDKIAYTFQPIIEKLKSKGFVFALPEKTNS